MDNLDNYKQFEELRTKKFKDMYNWSAVTPKHYGVEIETSKLIIDQMGRKTPHLDWVRNEGYTVIADSMTNKNYISFLEDLGQSGVPYRFYLMPSWTKQNYFEYLYYNYYFDENDDEINKIFTLLGEDIDNLNIYGQPKTSEYIIKIDNKVINMHEILNLYEEHKDEWDNFKKELLIDDDNVNMYVDESPLWGAKVPLRFNSHPTQGTPSYDVLCEYGLMMVKFEITKLIKAHGYNRYADLARNGYMDRMLDRETDTLIKYMNLSNVHVTRNEEIEIASTVSENLRKGSKLFDENHSDRQYKISVDLVQRFLKES